MQVLGAFGFGFVPRDIQKVMVWNIEAFLKACFLV